MKITLTQEQINENPLLQEMGLEEGDTIKVCKKEEGSDGEEERGAPPVEGPGGSNPPGKP